MKLEVLTVSIEAITKLRPIVARIRRHDRVLAKQAWPCSIDWFAVEIRQSVRRLRRNPPPGASPATASPAPTDLRLRHRPRKTAPKTATVTLE